MATVDVTDSKESGLDSHRAVTLHCGACGSQVGAGDPVVKYPYMLINGTGHWWFPGHVCMECIESFGRETTKSSFACAQCARPTFLLQGKSSTRVLCSKRCENIFYRTRKRTPIFTCEACNAPFTPNRADAKHCSPACKQKAYRQRKGQMSEAGGMMTKARTARRDEHRDTSTRRESRTCDIGQMRAKFSGKR